MENDNLMNWKPIEQLTITAGTPAALTIGKAINGLTKTVLSPLLLLDIISDSTLNHFGKKINDKFNDISEKNKDTSKLGLVLKDFEDLRYQLNEEDLQDMFANLISATIDTRKNSDISPIYSSILSQLGHKEAQFLNKLSQSTYSIIPAFEVMEYSGVSAERYSVSNLILGIDFDIHNIISDDSSINILESLGIIEIKTDLLPSSPNGRDFYSDAEIEKDNVIRQKSDFNPNGIYKNKKSCIVFTSFGTNFVKIVCNTSFIA